ncbi:fructose-bisphosphate aldolase-like [Belonocnema kinseyi]|uniref:fructose-bisphosphate aldolase-like n=1 Tax=Belonocnema kinseyi TaxID=2817044 RepID=UPI00143DDFAA|nr:fructose-bisphosphate aldolase-like [Belonocnema kinseyi]
MAQMEEKCSCKSKVSGKSVQYNKLEPALRLELRTIVKALSLPGKGLLAADESPSSLGERFKLLDLENSETTRRDYRQMLFSTDKSILAQYISGILLHHETLYQKTSDNLEFVELLSQKCIIPGIKVDKGLVEIFGTEGEKTTQGLDDLQERCIQYKRDGCHFTKWRCVFKISDKLPSRLAIVTNSNVLARYATISQSARLVPIVEPEILNEGDFTLEKALDVHEEVLSTLFQVFKENNVYLEGMILKPAMVLPGTNSKLNFPPQTIAEYTITALQRTVPTAVQTILFLSGGQPDYTAFLNLNAINLYDSKKPWTLTFCFGRALQNEAMKVWNGDSTNILKAQEIFLARAKLCSQASEGQMEEDFSLNENQ